MDLSSSFVNGKPQYYDVHPTAANFPYSNRDPDSSRTRHKFLKRSATFSYLLLQVVIIAAFVAICILPFWMRCHFFLLTPETVTNSTLPTSGSSNQFLALQQSSGAEAASLVAETSDHESGGHISNKSITTASSSGKVRRHRTDESPPNSISHNDSSLLAGFNSSEMIVNQDGQPVLRRYVTADIGLWETCQMGSCQVYGSVWKIFFEFEPSTWWLFLCRWLCVSGVGLTELLWLVVASIRFFYFNRRDQYHNKLSRVRSRTSNNKVMFSREPIAGALLLLIKAMTLAAIVGCLVTFRWHVNMQWPVDWRTQNGVIAHMGMSWLGMLAMGSCDAWLFLVTLLHTIAERRDRRRVDRAEAVAATLSSANMMLRPESPVKRRCSKNYCVHRQPSNAHHHYHHENDDDSILYSPSASAYYKPTPYEDDYAFNAPTLSRKPSMRAYEYQPEYQPPQQRHHCHHYQPAPPPPPQQHPATIGRHPQSNYNRNNTLHRTPGGKSLVAVSTTMAHSPIYIPHYDDEAIGGRAFY